MNERSINLIQQYGYRLTLQRQIILDILHEEGGHCTPEEIYQRVQVKSRAINRTIVYRTLEFPVHLGLVSTAHIQGNQLIDVECSYS